MSDIRNRLESAALALARGTSSLAAKIRQGFRSHFSTNTLIICILAAFTYGMAATSFKFFPYYELRPVFSFAKRLTGTQSKTVQITTGQLFHTTKEISTALLPLTADTFNLEQKVSMTGEAGGICEAGKNILVFDRIGLPFRFDPSDQSIIALNWPKLPNHFSEFMKSEKSNAKNNFRVHDVLCTAEANGIKIFLAHEFFDPETSQTHLVISSIAVDAALKPNRDKSWTRIFTSTPLPGKSYGANGAGGRMALDGKGHLYLTVGDYNLDGVLNPESVSQDKATDQGSILRITLATGEKQLVSWGHRNPQGLVILRNGEIISTEHAAKGGDELNRIEEGKNYGWPLVTYGTDYDLYSWPPSKKQGRHDGFEKPIFSWVPSIGVSEAIEVTSFDDRWDGDLLVGSLKAGTVFRLRYENGIIRYSEPIWFGPRIRDIIELSDHQIALWTDQTQLILLSVDSAKLTANQRVAAPVMPPGSVNCMACHHVGLTNENDAAPSLSGIVGREVASDNFANYSDALKNLGGTWTEDRLRAFLLNPNEVAPGTNMVIGDQTKSQVDKTIKYLKNLD